MRSAAAFRVLVALLVVAPALAAQERSDRLTLADYLDWETVQSPTLSPDGQQIVFGRRWVDKLNDRWETSLYVMGADGAKQRFLVKGSSAAWSPDGTRIAYLAQGEPRGSQLFVRWMDAEGAVTQITRVTQAPADLAWSPDGKWIAFRMLVPDNDNWKVEGKVSALRPRGADWTAAPRVVQKLNYRRDRVGYVADGTQQIFVVPAEGGAPRQVSTGEWNVGAPHWTPDGKTIVFSSGPRVPDAEYQWRESEVYALDVASGKITQLTHRAGPDGNPVISPDGKLIAYTGFDQTDDTWVDAKLYVMNADGSNPRVLTPDLDQTPQGLIWAADGSGIYFNVSEKGVRNLYFASLRGGAQALTRGNHVLSVDEIGRNGMAVGTMAGPLEPGDVVSFDLRHPDQVHQLTEVNADVLQGKTLGQVEEIWYKSVDGMNIQGWIIKPPHFDPARKYPLMLTIHGGPHSMYTTAFNFGWQEHAANDYVILYTNPRGSTGYGSAFGNAIKNAYPSKDFDDLMAGVDAVIAKGYVDTDNMFVYGCSGGGVLTAWTVGHTDRFAAASSDCPVIDWISFVGITDGASWYRNFKKLPWEDPTEHLQRSPLMYVGNVKTPTMLMTGVNDLRTPISQTEEFYRALKLLKVPTAMVRFNDEWHGTGSKPSNFIRTQLYLRDWFSRWSHKTAAKADAMQR